MARAFAPAKINLTLHVTGQRDDGLHLLDSLVVFADVGDQITVGRADTDSFSATGPYGDTVPTGSDNLACRAKALMCPDRPVSLSLTKTLPPSSGIGGGSSDAAATLRALGELFDLPLPDTDDTALLGADVPVCLRARPTRMSGIGEGLADVPSLPPLHFVLANPGVAVATPDVFRALTRKTGTRMPDTLPDWSDAPALARWLATQRNDLETPARRLAPAIGVTLSRLAATPDCLLARMSGSGATCFALYATRPMADAAADHLRQLHPDWWIAAASSWTLGR